MKRIYLIGGTMGIGKTSVCQTLKKELKNAVFLDVDWCWDANPFQVNDETKRMVIDNICHLLNNFITLTFCFPERQRGRQVSIYPTSSRL